MMGWGQHGYVMGWFGGIFMIFSTFGRQFLAPGIWNLITMPQALTFANLF
ncbi:MAG: hypothetical protein RRA15_03430 [bacterium]|nr:hypothetical protein [bacterium]MDT8365526.1 hypothetical protein [bacterium]